MLNASQADRDNFSKIDLDAFFLPAIENYVQQAREKIESKAREHRAIIEDFIASDLTMAEYAVKTGIPYKTLIYIRDRYKIYRRQITAADIDRIHTKSRRRKAETMLKIFSKLEA